ncbi:unnamed protein product [Boreogadus saida]
MVRCLGAEHAAAALVDPASCAACPTLPEEGLLSTHLFFSPSVDLAKAIDIFRAGVPDAQDADDEHIEVDDVASLDDVFADSTSGFSRSGASTEATVVPREKPRRMADLFGEIMGEAAPIKVTPMPAPPLAPMSDDMQGECFRTLSSSWRATQCPLFPPVQQLLRGIRVIPGQRSSAVSSPSLQPLCVLARAVRSTIIVGQHVEMGSSHTVQAMSPSLYGVGGDQATGPSGKHGSGSRGLMAATHPVVPLGLLSMGRLQWWFARQRLDPMRHKVRVLLLPRSVSPDTMLWVFPWAE